MRIVISKRVYICNYKLQQLVGLQIVMGKKNSSCPSIRHADSSPDYHQGQGNSFDPANVRLRVNIPCLLNIFSHWHYFNGMMIKTIA